MNLTEHEKKRLSVLQLDCVRSANELSGEKLTARDFLLLLKHDLSVQKIIKNIIKDDTSNISHYQCDMRHADAFMEREFSNSVPVPQPVQIQSINNNNSNLLRMELESELQLLRLVHKDSELVRAWLGGNNESEGRQLVRLVAVTSQWNQILLLWDRLAYRCRQTDRAATHEELEILKRSLNLHNLVWDGKAAETQHANIGEPFDYTYHERGTSIGDAVRGEWLPGLVSAAGMMQRKVLVAT